MPEGRDPDGVDANWPPAAMLREEARALRGLTRDLIAFSALPATWKGREPREVVDSFADASLVLLRADFVFLRLGYPPGRSGEVLRVRGRSSPADHSRLRDALADVVTGENAGARVRVGDPRGAGTLSMAVVPLGYEGEYGLAAAGSSDDGFPNDYQQALMGLAANQVAVALKERELVGRSRADLALRASEERFRSVFAHASVGMAVTSLGGQYLQVNPALCAIVGRTEADLLATDDQSVTHPADRPRQSALIARMLAGEIPWFVIDKRYLKPDGPLVWAQNRVSFTPDSEGRPRNLVVLVEDVTERRRAEEALRESERRFRAVFDGALDAMTITDDERRYVEVNPAACALLGRTRDELLGQPATSVSSPEIDWETAWPRFRAAGRGSGEWRFVRPDGTTRDVEYQSTADFVPGLHLSVMRDITGRKAVDAELQEKTELLQTILDNIPVMIRFTAADGGVEWVNREWQRVLGWSLEEARRTDVVSELYPEPADQDRVRLFMRGEMAGLWRDLRTRTQDGRILDISWANVVLSDGRVIGIGQDVTDRKRSDVERETRARQVQMLADTALAIGAATSLAEIARVVSSAARSVIGAHAAAVSFTLREDGSQAIAARSASDEDTAAGAGPLELGGSDHRRLVRRTNLPVRIAESRWMGVPLVGRDGRNLGLIELWGRFEGSFGDEDEVIVIQLAQLASGAAENARLLEEVSGGRARLEALSRRLVNLQEEERGAIARELHDEVGQVLTGLKLMLETTKGGGGVDLTQPLDLANELLHRVRNLSLNLRPPMLDDLGLVPTLLWHIERYRDQTRIEVRFHHRGVEGRYPAEVEIAAFRIVQEALTNVARHASVREAAVELSAEGGWLRIRVEDRGRGFDPHTPPGPASGLTGMRERASLAGGSLTVDARPGAGTQVVAQLPLPARAPQWLAR